MAANPFADLEEDDVKDAPQTEAVEAVADAWNGSVSATFKGRGEYGSSWYVVKAPSFERLSEILEDDEAVARALRAGYEVDKLVKQSEDYVSKAAPKANGGGKGNYQKPNNGGRTSSDGEKTYRSKGKPQAAEEHPNGDTSSCKHGEKVFRSGTKKTGPNAGDPWYAFDCPDNDCPREWTTVK